MKFDNVIRRNVIVIPSGSIAENAINEIYENCAVVVFPSFYEEFGLPIVNVPAFRKPVIARDIPPAREIRSKSPNAVNIYLHRTTEEIAHASGQVTKWLESISGIEPERWSDFAHSLERSLRSAEEQFSFSRLVKRLTAANSSQPVEVYMPHPAEVISRVLARYLEIGLRLMLRFKPVRPLARFLWVRRKRFRHLIR